MALHDAGTIPRRALRRIGASTAALLLAWAVCAPAATGDAAAGPVATAGIEPRVARLVVRFRSGFANPEKGVLRSDLVDELQALLGHSLSASPSTSARNQILRLAQPVGLREARRLLGVLRMRRDVVYAELDPSEREVAQKAVAARGRGTPTIRRLLVSFAEPMLALKSRNGEKLGVEWDERLSAAAGVPLRVARATVGGAWVVELLAAVDVAAAEALAARLQADGIARLAAPDYALAPMLVPNDPDFAAGKQWNLLRVAVGPNYGLDAERAWDITTGSPGIVIAVVDSGIVPHPDLAARILPGYNFITDPVSAGNGVGRSSDATDLGNWRTAGLCPAPHDTAADSSWHGTLVTGIAAATGNNGIGMAGIDWNAKVLPVRVSGKCGSSVADMIEGIGWATGIPLDGLPANPTPADVVNISLVASSPCAPLFQELIDLFLDLGIFIAAAAGNDNVDVANTFPANCLGLSTVGATDPSGTRASYSNFGPGVDISAPGGDAARYGLAGALYSTSNSGKTVAASPTYDYVQGTSFAAPQVAGVAALMMAANPALSPAHIKQLMAQTASPFAAGSDCATGLCGAGIVNAYAAVRAALTAIPPAPLNYQGLWWNAPAASESGWGINFAHQDDVIFATWFTYDATGKAWWLSMTATAIGDSSFSGTLYETRGPAFNASPFNPTAVRATAVGDGLLTFSDANNGVFDYTIRGVKQAKAITRQAFGPLPACAWGAQPNLPLATNYQDLWWAAPAGVESGWGVNFSHQGDIIFATWFTYDFDGAPLWLSLTARRSGPQVYTGDLYRTTGPAFDAQPFSPSSVVATPVGTATLTFADGNHASFAYSVTLGTPPTTVRQTKQVTRQVFRAPGTVCQ